MTVAGCVFCAIVAGDVPAHIVASDDATLAFLDARPVFPGHALLVPRTHLETLTDLPPDQVAPLFAAVQRLARGVEAGMEAHGTFVAMNNRVSQSVPHLHVHVVPRRRKDGLRGFFWPRQRYADDAEMAAVAGRIRAAVTPP
ncbi:MAG TPA: HIT family protein [Acidimicrobiales bacterium]|nr:HIT family protein [Acidimicrobiales bacterium]